jgi:hypothetical protein
MTEPLLNQLLDEAVERCHELATHAQAAATAGADVSAEALGLAQVVETEAQNLHADVAQALEALQGAAGRITDAADAAIATLQSIPGRASQSSANVRGMLEALSAELLSLDGARQHLLEGLKTSGETLAHDTKDLAEGVQAYVDRVEAAWKQPMTGMQELTKEAQDLRLQIDDRGALVRKDTMQLGKVALEQCDAFADGTVRGAQAIADQATTTLNEALHRHNTEMAELRAWTLEETPAGIADPNWIDNTLLPLENEIGWLAPVAGQIEEALFAPLSAISTVAERAEQQLETAAQSLAKVLGR